MTKRRRGVARQKFQKRTPVRPGDRRIRAGDKSLVIDSIPDEKSLFYLRWAAGVYFSTSINGVTIRDISTHPVFSAASHDQIKKWAADDGWIEQRRSMLERIRTTIEARIGGEIVQYRLGQMKDLQEVYTKSIDILMNRSGGMPPVVNSYEGLLNATIKLVTTLDEFREKFGRQVSPVLAGQGHQDAAGVLPVRPKLTPSEARIVAKAMLVKHREETRALIKRGDDADDEEISPPKAAPRVIIDDGGVEIGGRKALEQGRG